MILSTGTQGFGDLGFEVPGFVKDIAAGALSAAGSSIAKSRGNAPAAPAAKPTAPRPAAKPAGMSTGTKIAIGFGGLLGVGLLLKALKKG